MKCIRYGHAMNVNDSERYALTNNRDVLDLDITILFCSN